MTRPPLKRSTLWALGLYAGALVATLSIVVVSHFEKKPAVSSGPARDSGPAPIMMRLTLTNSYVGDEACAACHQQKTIGYHRTAHYITSAWPTKESIKGKFTPGANVLKTTDPNLHFEMQASETGQVQTAVRQVSPSVVGHRTERFDLVVGSGR